MLRFPSPHNAKSYFEAIWAVDHNFLLLFPLNFARRCSSDGKQHQTKRGHLHPSWYWRLHPYQGGCHNAAQNNLLFFSKYIVHDQAVNVFLLINSRAYALDKKVHCSRPRLIRLRQQWSWNLVVSRCNHYCPGSISGVARNWILSIPQHSTTL